MSPFSKLSQIPWRRYLSRIQHYGLALTIFLLGLLISLAFFRFYEIQEQNRNRAEFDRLADVRLVLIQDTLEGTLEQLRSIKNFYYASDLVTKRDFQIFVRPSFALYPNLLAIGWIPFSNEKEFHKHLYFTSLEETLPSQMKTLSFEYLELKNTNPLYIDEQAYSELQHLMQQAALSSSLLLSNTAIYFQDGLKKGFFSLNPVHLSESLVHTQEANPLKGLLIGFSDFNQLIQVARSRLEPIGINVAIYDKRDETKKLLYSSFSFLSPPFTDKSKQRPPWIRSSTFPIGNRVWTIEATPSEFFFQQRQYWRHWEVLVAGFLISALSGIYLLFLTNRHILVEQEVQNRTEELATINRVLQQEIHQRQRIEENFRQRQQYLQKRQQALEHLTKFTTGELKKAIQEVILQTAVVMQIDRVSVWLYEEQNERRVLSCKGLYRFSTNSFSNHLEFISTYFSNYFKALSTHSYLIIPSQEEASLNQELESYLTASHITSKLDIPIVLEGRLFGVLCCEETRNKREWLLEDRHFAQTIADIVAIMIEQSAKIKAEKALLESEERLRFLMQKSIDAIISVTDQGKINSWNYGAELIFGYSEMAILDKPLSVILPEQSISELEAATKPIEMQGRNQEGRIFPVEVSHTRWKSVDHYFNTIIIRDMTERKEYETRLIKAIKEAQAANAAKTHFLATISHELRTPLNAIIGFNQCLLMEMDGPINEQQKEDLKRIEKSSSHLLYLINDLLDLGKVEADKIELDIHPYNIAQLLTSCVDDIRPLAQNKSLELELSIPKSTILIEGDQMRIKQVLLNLLGNAVKFTEKGSIQAQLFNYSQYIEIRITDTGIGLSQEETLKIFKPFSQADSSITRKYGGTGLGLAISKRILDLHGGTIDVKSEKGKGSVFIVTLPKNLY